MSDDERERRPHEFSEGQGLDEDYEEFTLDPEELNADPSQVDPVDTRVIADLLDERNIPKDRVDVESLMEVGLSYMGIHRFEEATETFERAAQFADDDSLEEQEAWVNKGAAHAQLEEWDEAEGAYREALRIDDDSEHAAAAETNLAYALHEDGRTEQALEHAERAVEVDPRFPQAWYNRGFFLVERGLLEDAVTAFDNAIRLGMRNSEVLEEKARALDELGREEEAEEVAARAEQIRKEAEQEMVEEHAEGGGGARGGGARGGRDAGGAEGAGGAGGVGGAGGMGGTGGDPLGGADPERRDGDERADEESNEDSDDDSTLGGR